MWDLNKLREGGDVGLAFAAAFVAVNSEEIINSPGCELNNTCSVDATYAPTTNHPVSQSPTHTFTPTAAPTKSQAPTTQQPSIYIPPSESPTTSPGTSSPSRSPSVSDGYFFSSNSPTAVLYQYVCNACYKDSTCRDLTIWSKFKTR